MILATLLSPLVLAGDALGGAVAGARTRLAEIRQWREDRDAFRHMLALDDQMLTDIGVTRADVEWAASLPIHRNAAQDLAACARKRSRRM